MEDKWDDGIELKEVTMNMLDVFNYFMLNSRSMLMLKYIDNVMSRIR